MTQNEAFLKLSTTLQYFNDALIGDKLHENALQTVKHYLQDSELTTMDKEHEKKLSRSLNQLELLRDQATLARVSTTLMAQTNRQLIKLAESITADPVKAKNDVHYIIVTLEVCFLKILSEEELNFSGQQRRCFEEKMTRIRGSRFAPTPKHPHALRMDRQQRIINELMSAALFDVIKYFQDINQPFGEHFTQKFLDSLSKIDAEPNLLIPDEMTQDVLKILRQTAKTCNLTMPVLISNLKYAIIDFARRSNEFIIPLQSYIKGTKTPSLMEFNKTVAPVSALSDKEVDEFDSLFTLYCKIYGSHQDDMSKNIVYCEPSKSDTFPSTMCKTQPAYTLEYLPNEIILYSIARYLKIRDIFYSFDQLNTRFNTLIRCISFHLDFPYIREITNDQFFQTVLSNAEMKNQVYSLHLSNSVIPGQILSFLANYEFNVFPNLQSLTLTDINENDMPMLIQKLPLVSKLFDFRVCWTFTGETDKILSELSISNLKTLMLPNLSYDLNIYKTLPLMNLIISECESNQIYQILASQPYLKYINVQNILQSDDVLPNDNLYSTELRRLILRTSYGALRDLGIQSATKPSLESLRIDASNMAMIDAKKLKSFKFEIVFFHESENDGIEEIFQQFQRNNWHIEYSISKDSVLIYTIPYLSNTFELKSNMTRYCNEMKNSSRVFNNVTTLDIGFNALRQHSQYQFAGVTSLILRDSKFDEEKIYFLKDMVSLSILKNLDISNYSDPTTPSLLLEILKQAKQISSLSVSSTTFKLCLDNKELCECLKRMIKQLHILKYNKKDPFIIQHHMEQFCNIFLDIEQLTCTINPAVSNDKFQVKIGPKYALLDVIKQLPRLSRMTVNSNDHFYSNQISWVKEEGEKLGIKIITNLREGQGYSTFPVWIIRNTS